MNYIHFFPTFQAILILKRVHKDVGICFLHALVSDKQTDSSGAWCGCCPLPGPIGQRLSFHA